ncbi:MAG: enoyl-CoA hydratase/isomerase family protein [Phycisphaerales bacterium]|nr:enoyl-CoA hydratase/isomerase family protein [Phycisphaerales bacterium]
MVQLEIDPLQPRVAALTLADPLRRNALSVEMFAAFTQALDAFEAIAPQPTVLLLRAEGAHFCAGFDLAAVVAQPLLAVDLLHQLSHIIRRLKRLDAIVVGEVRGAALAGGCALLTACDFVVAAADAQLGYPTHRIGISPAVSIPSLAPKTRGATRAFLVSNEILSGTRAFEMGLVTHVAAEPQVAVRALVTSLLSKDASALRETKRYLNNAEDAGEDAVFDAAMHGSADLARGTEFAEMLRAYWSTKR